MTSEMTYRPPIACQRASRSAPMPRSSGGSLAMSATKTTNPYSGQQAEDLAWLPVSIAPRPWMTGVSRHHRATTAVAPRAMTAKATPGTASTG